MAVSIKHAYQSATPDDPSHEVSSSEWNADHGLTGVVDIANGGTGTTSGISAATQASLDLKAPLASPAFSGNPTAPTPAIADRDTSIATTAFVNQCQIIGPGVDFNTVVAPGTYVNAGSSANTPKPDQFYMSVITYGSDTSLCVQQAFSINPDASIYTRVQIGGTWYPWVAASIPPSTVAPSMNGVAAVGAAVKYAREDHVHPSDTAKEDKTNKGIANGYASLDAGAKVPAAQLPSYVDDVLEYASTAAFPATGTTGVIYVALDTGKIYRWSGSAYIEISPSPGSTDAVPEGSVNLYYTNGRASAAAPVQSVAARTGVVTLTKSDVGLANVDNTSDASKPISTATQAGLDARVAKVGDTMSGALRVTPNGSSFGAPDGTAAQGSPVIADANIVLYGAGANWAGIGADNGGQMWFRTGLSGTPNSAMFIRADQTVVIPANGTTVGQASGGDVSVGPPANADANLLFYGFGTANWCGMGTDANGTFWFRTGLSGSPQAAWYIKTDQITHFNKSPVLPADPTNPLEAATKQYVDAGVTTALKIVGGQTITGGFKITPANLGTGAGTVTPDPFAGNYQYVTNNAAFTVAAPTSDCAMDILITNGATAGVITFTGFATSPTGAGDALNQTNAAKFLVSIRRIAGTSFYTIKQVS